MAIHLVDQSPAVCGHPTDDPCTGIERRQVVLTGENPQTDLLGTGDVQTVMGWTVRVERVDHASATLALTPTAR